MKRTTWIASVSLVLTMAGMVVALDKEVSLVTTQAIGDIAVAGRLSIDLHAEFMLSRTYDKDTALNWYNCGYSGGGRNTSVGGNFGDFGLHVPYTERDEKYPHAVSVDKVPAVRFDGNDIMKGNFAVETNMVGAGTLALELWLRAEKPGKGEAILGWQSRDGKETSAAVTFPDKFAGSDKWRHVVVNCAADKEDWYLDGQKISSGKRAMMIGSGQIMVLGGANASKPSFKGDIAALRLHDQTMAEEEIAHNFKGGVMLGTELKNWWRTESNQWWVAESPHFRHAVDKNEIKMWNEQQLKEFNERVPRMFDMAELIYHTYTERLAMRSAVVGVQPQERGDGIKYKTGIQPSGGSWMGWDGHFGWACQGAGHINPHELAHGWYGMTGGMAGNYWEVCANFPQTYNGIYQTAPPSCVSRVCMFFPAHGRAYYHDRLMFEHLAQTPEYGPMFVAKMWYDGPTETERSNYPWITFDRLDPDPKTPLAYEYTRMVQKNVTWDYVTYADAAGGKGNTPFGNDHVVSSVNRYQQDAKGNMASILRYSRILLERIPYEPESWRVPKDMAPQQCGWNICPMEFKPGKVSAVLTGYVDPQHGSDWRAAFVGVDTNGKPVYGDIVAPGKAASLDVTAEIKELYLIVCAIPKNMMSINMVGDYRSFEQDPYPYKVKLAGCTPKDVMVQEAPKATGAPHANGGGFVEASAKVDATAYVGPEARVMGKSQILGNARILDRAVIQNSTVRDNAVVSGYALVNNSTVQDFAKVRDYAVANSVTVKDNAKILEHAEQSGNKTCSGYAVVKGGAASFGNVSGTAMVDGSYAKGNEVTKGRWFTWSWGQGKNAGEVDEDFGGVYADYDFEREVPWMAWDAFGATWGYLVNEPQYEVIPAAEKMKSFVPRYPADTITNRLALALNGKDQFVELPKDIADMRDCTYTVEFKWDGGAGWSLLGKKTAVRLFEFASTNGDAVWLSPDEKGTLLFAIRKGATVESVSAPAIKKGVWTSVQVMLEGSRATLLVDGKTVGENTKMTLKPDSIRATQCYLGRGINGGYFGGKIDRFTVHSVSLVDHTPPSPNPAAFELQPQFLSPTCVLLSSVPGADALGAVQYCFEEEGRKWSSGWTNANVIRLEGRNAASSGKFRVKMRDKLNNETAFSELAQPLLLKQARVFDAGETPIAIEAEHFANNVASADGFKWEVVKTPEGFVGEGAIQILPDKGGNCDPPKVSAARVDYLVNFTQSGRYFVRLRARGVNFGGDSIHMGLDMAIAKWGDNIGMRNNRYTWGDRREIIIDKPGIRTFSIWMREDGAIIDRILFCRDGKYEPDPDKRDPDKALVGPGPAESASREIN